MRAVYIHIPFCKHICSYCDFCKLYYNKQFVNNYLKSLRKEIESNYKGEKIKTLYIGGGTPSCLDISELNILMEIIKIFNMEKDFEFTFECNIENIEKNKMEILYKNNVNRLSIGVETFNSKHLSFLERNHSEKEVFSKIDMAKKIGFGNINIDLIYALPNQTIDELKKDLSLFLQLGIKHISTYSLIIEPHTKLYINNIHNIDDQLDSDMFNTIKQTLENNNYIHYEISNFAIKGYESRHNLTYWNNLEYYGFGLGASGYVDNVRYDNTKSLNRYLEGKYCYSKEEIDRKTKIENELILGFRKLKGINKENFYNKYRMNISSILSVKKLIEEGKLIDDGENVYIKEDNIYLSNEILINFIGEENE
jgi:oxygen-independent coproporphyrinogen-3 oxidase